MPGTADFPQTELEASLAAIPFRQPVMDYGPPVLRLHPDETHNQSFERLRAQVTAIQTRNAAFDRQWLVLTEAARAAVLGNPGVRRGMVSFAAVPLSESLPLRAIAELAERDKRVASLAETMHSTLGAVLELPEVPDDVLWPDIRHAAPIQRREDAAKELVRRQGDPEDFALTADSLRDRVAEKPGVTEAERELVARRYRYARDVKLLSLIAELSDQPIKSLMIEQDGTARHTLESGTKLVMTTEAFSTVPGLLDPANWESRRQLKDRVYSVRIAGRNYILKERKTARHTDTKDGGHQAGLTSEQEFRAARAFAELGTVTKGDVSLHWEKPLGYVEFPDGYQFCLFARESGLIDQPLQLLTEAITDSAEAYRDEFTAVSHRAREIYRNRPDLLTDAGIGEQVLQPRRFAVSKASRRYNRAVRGRPDAEALTFKEFARLKAQYLILEATDLLTQIIHDKGYVNSDQDGYAYKVHSDVRAGLEIVGFDFEYYLRHPRRAARIQENMKHFDQTGQRTRFYADRGADRRIEAAASYAMLERFGWELPPPELEPGN